MKRLHVLVTVMVLGLGWPPPTGAQALLSLPLKGFGDAVVVPAREDGLRPVMVMLHGNFDRPEWNCAELRELVQGRGWLLCVRGIRRRDVSREQDRWTYPSRSRVMAEIEAGLAALKAQYPERVDTSPPVLLAGYSMGAIIAARFAVADPKRFPRLYLAEGSYKVWTPSNCRRFAKGGGQAVLFGCGVPGCVRKTGRICRRLGKLGVDCKTVVAPGLGHRYGDPLPRLSRPLFRQLVRPDKRWAEVPTANDPGRKQ